MVQAVGRPGPAAAEGSPRRGGGRGRGREAGEQGLGPADGRQGLVRPSGLVQQDGDGQEAAADLDLRLGAGPRLPRQRLPRRQHRPMRRQCILLPPDLARQLGHLEVRLRQRPPRRPVRLLPEQGPELAVEARGRSQQPVAQGPELRLLEQELLADAGVEGPDRLDRQVVPLLDAGVGRGDQRWPSPRFLHGDDRGRADEDRQEHRRRQPRDRRPPPAPEPRPLGDADPTRRDRPAVEPSPQVVGQGLRRRVASAWGTSPGISGRSSPGRAGWRR